MPSAEEFASILELDTHMVKIGWEEASASTVQELISGIESCFSNLTSENYSLFRKVEMIASHIHATRISSLVSSANDHTVGAASDLFIKYYSSALSRRFDQIAMDSNIELFYFDKPISNDEFVRLVENFVTSSSCSIKHPIFSFLEEDANKHQLALTLWAENLVDLNFVNILAYLMHGLSGVGGIEIANNFYDEIGHCDLDNFHIQLRKNMMRDAGLPNIDDDWQMNTYLTEEFEHFNAYCSVGAEVGKRYRLIGMMFATEYLVPSQLDAVIRGWKRTGMNDDEMKYMLEHAVGDVEHGRGWADRVVLPDVKGNLFRQKEVLIGVLQHVEILTRFYDQLHASLIDDSKIKSITPQPCH